MVKALVAVRLVFAVSDQDRLDSPKIGRPESHEAIQRAISLIRIRRYSTTFVSDWRAIVPRAGSARLFSKTSPLHVQRAVAPLPPESFFNVTSIAFQSPCFVVC